MSVEIPDELLEGYRRFRREVLPPRKVLLDRLSRERPHPWAMVVACSEPSAIPEAVLGAEPGELFVVRNVGNVVPPPDEKESEMWAAVEYGIYRLKVPYLIVMGHDGCGGIKASFGPPPSEEMEPFLHHWVTYMESSKTLADEIRIRSTRFASVVRTNVIIQLERIRSHPLVYAALKSDHLTLIGLVYNADRELEIYDDETEEFLPIPLG